MIPSAASSSDVLTVSKFAVTVANVNPAIKVDHVSQSVSYDLDHAYTVPSVALNPYAGHTDAPASAAIKAAHSAALPPPMTKTSGCVARAEIDMPQSVGANGYVEKCNLGFDYFVLRINRVLLALGLRCAF